MRGFPLKPCIYTPSTRKIYGFDIETHGSKNDFVCGSVYLHDKKKWFFTDKQAMQEFFFRWRMDKSYIAATNLSFDFYGLFFGSPLMKRFNLLGRGSTLISATVKIDKSTVVFIDTRNYSPLSVQQLGRLINLPKLDHHDLIGKIPQNEEQWQILKDYNMRDAEISKKSIDFLFNSFEQLKAKPEITIAKTALNYFRSSYLKEKIFGHTPEVLKEIFEGYYGGRTETFTRGKISNVNLYDINSLYPAMMRKKLPHPNSVRVNSTNSLMYLQEFEGMSKVTITAPQLQYPLLPCRHEGKLLFPTGTFTGYYTNVELRKALSLGYKITRVFRNIYYKETYYPLKQYAEDLYQIRLKYKKEDNPMQLVVKLLLNSLYGKFGQKFWGWVDFQPFDHTIEQLNKLDHFERIGDYIRIVKEEENPAPHCIPIWASYLTAYGRLELYKYICKYKALYCDTDSIITKEILPTSLQLGRMKHEGKIINGILVKPKFYFLKFENDEYSKIKGYRNRLKYKAFVALLDNREGSYKKFLKIREAIRQKKQVNEIVKVLKHFDLEDNKRIWKNKFNYHQTEESIPIEMQS